MASHRVHVHVHIGNHHTSRSAAPTRRRKARPAGRRGGRVKGRKYNTFAGARPGSGRNFAALSRSLGSRRGVKNSAALAAWIGRNKYGSANFSRMGAAGRRRV